MNISQRGAPVPPTPEEFPSPHVGPQTPWLCPNPKVLANVGEKGAWVRSEWFIPKPPACSPYTLFPDRLAFSRKASASPAYSPLPSLQ